jgi:hypothetical protein
MSKHGWNHPVLAWCPSVPESKPFLGTVRQGSRKWCAGGPTGDQDVSTRAERGGQATDRRLLCSGIKVFRLALVSCAYLHGGTFTACLLVCECPIRSDCCLTPWWPRQPSSTAASVTLGFRIWQHPSKMWQGRQVLLAVSGYGGRRDEAAQISLEHNIAMYVLESK